MTSNTTSFLNGILKSALLLAFSTFMLSPQVAADDMAAEYAKKGAGTCLKCHDEQPVNLILHTPHAQRADANTPFAAHDCETCHGASPEHVKEPAHKGDKHVPPKIVFGRHSKNYPVSPVADQNAVCLTCHQSGLRMGWHASQHEMADVPCASCHNPHTLKDPVLVRETQPEVCFTCHVEQRSQVHLRSHHPITDGKVVCMDCHNPHGGPGPFLLTKNTVNETCYQCHAEKRGPMLWEHPPVREDCMNCHTPHGSTQARLLKVRTPYLCNMCHSETFHPSTLRTGVGVPPNGADDRLMAKGCLNCHSQIHGSNHPSGSRFTR